MPVSRKKPEDAYFLDECRPCRGSVVKRIKNFDARGKRSVYGQGDHFGRRLSFHMDVWKARSGALLVRFWSRSAEIKQLSYEVTGMPPNRQPNGARPEDDDYPDSSWIPQPLRKEYYKWIQSEFRR
jgi:hypothetical protein